MLLGISPELIVWVFFVVNILKLKLIHEILIV